MILKEVLSEKDIQKTWEVMHLLRPILSRMSIQRL
jgi:hypothetical protein